MPPPPKTGNAIQDMIAYAAWAAANPGEAQAAQDAARVGAGGTPVTRSINGTTEQWNPSAQNDDGTVGQWQPLGGAQALTPAQRLAQSHVIQNADGSFSSIPTSSSSFNVSSSTSSQNPEQFAAEQALRERTLAQNAMQFEEGRGDTTAAAELLFRRGLISQAQRDAFTTAERLGSQTFTSGENAVQRQFTGAENLAQRQANAAEGLAGRNFQGAEAVAQRNFQGQQSAIERAQAASQFAANFGLQAQAQRQSQLNDLYTRQQAAQQLGLNAAQATAQNVSLVDPAALPAFYAAGGGNISNALAGGANAVSRNAILPAAQSLDVANMANAMSGQLGGQYSSLQGSPLPAYTAPAYSFTPEQFRPVAGPQGGGGFDPRAAALAQAGLTDTGQGGFGAAPAPVAAPAAQAPLMLNGAPLANTADNAATLAMFHAAQGGTFMGNTGVITGDSRNGRPNPEMVLGAGPISVIPLSQLAQQRFMPHAASGGVFNGLEQMPQIIPNAPVTDLSSAPLVNAQLGQGVASQPSLDRIAALRAGVDVSAPMGIGTMNPQFGLLPPSLQSRYYAALQSRYGIPAGDVAAEQQRYALSGVRRAPTYGQYTQFGI